MHILHLQESCEEDNYSIETGERGKRPGPHGGERRDRALKALETAEGTAAAGVICALVRGCDFFVLARLSRDCAEA